MTDENNDESSRPAWDAALAAALLGKYVIVGLMYLEADGATVRERVQAHGVVINAATTGFVLSLKGQRMGETMTLPPNTRAFVKASPGRYRLIATGEVVYNPDYTSLWTFPARVLH